MNNSLDAADTSPALPGTAVAGRLRSTECDRGKEEDVDDAATGNGVDEAVEFVERLISGEEQRLGTEAEVEGDGDMYLEETCLDLGRLGTRPLSFSEGKSGGLAGFRRWVSWV